MRCHLFFIIFHLFIFFNSGKLTPFYPFNPGPAVFQETIFSNRKWYFQFVIYANSSQVVKNALCSLERKRFSQSTVRKKMAVVHFTTIPFNIVYAKFLEIVKF